MIHPNRHELTRRLFVAQDVWEALCKALKISGNVKRIEGDGITIETSAALDPGAIFGDPAIVREMGRVTTEGSHGPTRT